MNNELASGLATAAVILALCLGLGSCQLMWAYAATMSAEAKAAGCTSAEGRSG
jgi:hypothetical protein